MTLAINKAMASPAMATPPPRTPQSSFRASAKALSHRTPTTPNSISGSQSHRPLSRPAGTGPGGHTYSSRLAQQRARRAAREMEAWSKNFGTNDDRNDDALYHRSFDDGSMHLVSSNFRDGKPVDNHGKAVSSMGGASAVTKYRDHALQAPMIEGESATFVPLGEDNATLRYFAASNIKEHERGWSGLKGAPPWNNASHRTVPYTLRGLKITSNEPWVDGVGRNPETDFATSVLSRLDDGQRDTPVELFNRRREEDWNIAGNRGLTPWFTSPKLWVFPAQNNIGWPGGSLHEMSQASSYAGYEDLDGWYERDEYQA